MFNFQYEIVLSWYDLLGWGDIRLTSQDIIF